MNNYIINHKDAARASLANFLKRPFGSLLIVIMLGIAVTLPLTLYLAVQSSKRVVGTISAVPQLTVFLSQQSEQADIEDVRKTLSAEPRVKELRFIPKADALVMMQDSLGTQDLVSLLDGNPLPDAFVVTPRSSDPATVQGLKTSFATIRMVDQVSVDSRWMDTLYRMQSLLDSVLWFLAVALGLAFVLVSYNTIRLQILAHKEEIEITKLLGATNSYIRRPFLYHAALQGAISVCVGLIASYFVMRSAHPDVSEIMNSYGIELPWRFFGFGETIVVFLLVVLLGVAGAWWATSQHLMEFKRRR